VKEADSEYECPPIGMIDLIQEFLRNNCCECLIESSLKPLRRFISDLDGLLEESKGELWVLLTSDPESEVFMDNCIEYNDRFDFLHELQPQMAVLQDNPTTSLKARADGFPSDFFLSLSHRYLLAGELLLLLSQLIYRRGWVSTSR